ncbi:MAG: hypothetical protein KF882_08435 [Bacteroidia bacterium]|nr:hypothetical protein [Bacteroidia bacterium]MCO5253543.1 type III secretion system effector protein [Bacteroidota bacterium]
MNTQEKDDEIYGKGNSYSAEYWQYDARLGRRWNVDPKPNPSISVYAAFANNPIWFSDVAGDTIKIPDASSKTGTYIYTPGIDYDGNDNVICETVQALNRLYTGPIGKMMIDDLHSMESSLLITRQSKNGRRNYYNVDAKTVGWNPNVVVNVPVAKGDDFVNTPMDPFLVLGHELGHAWDYHYNKSQNVFGLNPDKIWYSTEGYNSETIPYSEVFAVHVENQIRLEHGYPLRTHYSLDKDKLGNYKGQLVQKTSTGSYSTFDVHTTTLIQIVNPGYNGLLDYSPMGSEFQEFIWVNYHSQSPFKYD